MRIILSSCFASYIQNEVHFCINIFTFHHVLFDCTICIHWNTAYRDIRWGQWNCRGYCVNCITINNWTWKCLGDWKWTTINISWCLAIDRFTRSNEFETIISYNQESKSNISLWTKTHHVTSESYWVCWKVERRRFSVFHHTIIHSWIIQQEKRFGSKPGLC